jgi:hypothetical protein
MRHGRKTKRKRIDGYKRHVAVDVDSPGIICAVAITPANQPERTAAATLFDSISRQGLHVASLYTDRGYLGDDAIEARRQQGMAVHCKPFPLRNGDHFHKGHSSSISPRARCVALTTSSSPSRRVTPRASPPPNATPAHSARSAPVLAAAAAAASPCILRSPFTPSFATTRSPPKVASSSGAVSPSSTASQPSTTDKATAPVSAAYEKTSSTSVATLLSPT